jgi:hypothetical protein
MSNLTDLAFADEPKSKSLPVWYTCDPCMADLIWPASASVEKVTVEVSRTLEDGSIVHETEVAYKMGPNSIFCKRS